MYVAIESQTTRGSYVYSVGTISYRSVVIKWRVIQNFGKVIMSVLCSASSNGMYKYIPQL